MKAISIKQPWASLIVHGVKGIENRTWKCPNKYIGKRILIHASAKPDKNRLNALTEDQLLMIPATFKRNKLYQSAIIGSVKIEVCVQNHPSIWAEKGVYNWVLSDPIVYENPIENIKGKLSFWEYEIPRDNNHQFFWIEDGILFETYSTIRGNRYRALFRVKYDDRRRVDDKELSLIEIVNPL